MTQSQQTEISLKRWLADESARCGISPAGVRSRYYHQRKYRKLRIRRVNKRVVFVIL